MAALFAAFNTRKYQKLIPHHLVEMLTLPEEVLSDLKPGGFTVSIPCHSIGSHAMCINRECKQFITKPTADYINRIATFLPIRSNAMTNIESKVFPEKSVQV